MTPRLRKFALIAHITSSVGWLGAVAGFLALSIAGLTSQDAEVARGAYLAMKLTAWFVIVPLAFASLLTGLVQSLGTTWGLFRHYWILAKLLLTVFATIILLLKMKLIGYVAGVAAVTALSSADLRQGRTELVVHAAGGLLVLLAITTLSVFKPWGRTRYGRRRQQERRESARLMSLSPITMASHHESSQMLEETSTSPTFADPDNEKTVDGFPKIIKILLAVIGVIVVGFVVLHHLIHGGLGSSGQ